MDFVVEIFRKHNSQAADEVKKIADFDRLASEQMRQPEENAVAVIRSWFAAYKVLRGLKNVDEVVEQTIRFCGKLQPGEGWQFAAESVRQLVDSLPKGENRLVSLSSKALWLRYPRLIPLYDSFAVRSLDFLARASDLLPEQKDPIDRYYQLWFYFFEIYEGSCLIRENSLRQFDKVLWLAGRPLIHTKRHAS